MIFVFTHNDAPETIVRTKVVTSIVPFDFTHIEAELVTREYIVTPANKVSILSFITMLFGPLPIIMTYTVQNHTEPHRHDENWHKWQEFLLLVPDVTIELGEPV